MIISIFIGLKHKKPYLTIPFAYIYPSLCITPPLIYSLIYTQYNIYNICMVGMAFRYDTIIYRPFLTP